MSENKLVKRFVKGPKGIWCPNIDGAKVLYGVGEEIMLPPRQAETKKRYLFTPKEFAAYNDTLEAALEASQDAKDERTNVKPEPKKEPATVKKPTTEAAKTKVKKGNS